MLKALRALYLALESRANEGAPRNSSSPPNASSPAESKSEEAYELRPGKGRAELVTLAYSSPVDTRIEVFWKDFVGAGEGVDPRLRDGIGPVISLIVAGFETMRFDCLGASGHYHAVLVRPQAEVETRVWFRERDQLEQVRRSVFELERNLGFYLGRNPRPEVRNARIDPEEHGRLCRLAEESAVALWERHGASTRTC